MLSSGTGGHSGIVQGRGRERRGHPSELRQPPSRPRWFTRKTPCLSEYNRPPRQALTLVIHYPNGEPERVAVQSRLDTQDEIAYFKAGGILQFVLNKLVHAV